MEKAYTAFATQVIELCIGSPDTNRTIIALAYIEIELQHHPVHNLPEEKKEIGQLCQQGSLFRKEDAEVSCRSPSAATNPYPNIHRQHKR